MSSRLRYLAYPLALSLLITPVAGAQSSFPSVPNQPGLSDYLQDDVPQRTPIRTDYPEIKGLPDGVSVDRVEWITDRRIAVFIKSAAMPGEPVQVQMLLARDWYSNPAKTYPEVWALDGLRALDTENGWTINTNIEQMFADKNVNVILPVGGESSFYSDWLKENNGKNYKWETFLTQELPAVLKQGYRSNGQRAITGISMGGTAAMNLAQHRPDMFNFVGSFSGYLDTTSPGMPLAIRGALSDAGGYDATAMWGPDGSQQWIDHDPKLGLDALKGKTVYVSSGSGKDDFGEPGSVATGPANPAGIGLEVVSRMTTQTFVDRANRAGLEVISQFRGSGVHAWPYWQFEMVQAWPYIADSLGLSKEDRGADCATVGAIAEATASGDYGSCTVNEYDVKGGKAQDFRRGRAYWSPDTGAHVLFGRIGAVYAEAGGPESWLGFPTTGEQVTPDGHGRYVHFQNGSIYWTPETDAQAIPKDMFDAWGENGWEAGDLGYPVSAPKEHDGKLVQTFQRGFIVRNSDKAYWVRGEIAKKYGLLDTVNSKLGAPVGNEELINGGALQRFEEGSIYWSPATGANVIFNGPIRDAWGEAGWENGKFGFPAKDQEKIPAGGEKVVFEHGTISQINGKIVEK